jgi:hypothetical protein
MKADTCRGDPCGRPPPARSFSADAGDRKGHPYTIAINCLFWKEDLMVMTFYDEFLQG